MDKFLSLKDLFCKNRERIVQEIYATLQNAPWSSYFRFLQTNEGRRRVGIWVDLMIRSLGDEEGRKLFFMDTERVGYSRALQGFKVEDVLQLYNILQKVLVEILQEAVNIKRGRIPNLFTHISEMNQILLQCIIIISASFLKTREEMIAKNVSYFQTLYDFTQKLIITLNLEEVVNLILKKIISIFEVEACLLAVYRGDQIRGIYNFPIDKKNNDLVWIVEDTLRERSPLFLDDQSNIHRRIDNCDLKRIVSTPVYAHGNCLGVLALCNHTRSFRFTEKELEFLDQFINIIGMALENAFMFEEIEQSHQELRLLTQKLITIQEEERRRLAEDIHDTLAQSLTGIGYKIQHCKDLLGRNPRLLGGQFDNLIENINSVIDQSREIISSLRPDLIDTMGLVPALKRHIVNFEQETGIRVAFQLSKNLQLCSETSICLFRIAQEGLMNIYKHSDTKSAELVLRKEDGNIILVIADNGKGLDMSLGAPWIKNQNKLGLLSMRNRIEAIGGTLVIKSEANRGFRIEAKVPHKHRVQSP